MDTILTILYNVYIVQGVNIRVFFQCFVDMPIFLTVVWVAA